MINFRLKFAQQANAVGPWIQQKTEEIVGVALEMAGTLEEQIQKLKIYQVIFFWIFFYRTYIARISIFKTDWKSIFRGFPGWGKFCTTWFLTPETPKYDFSVSFKGTILSGFWL